jgi:hypothetical protein
VVEAGEPVNVTLQIEGEGNFKTMAAPKIPEIPGFKLYESGSTSELFKNDYVVSGRKRIEFVLIPQVEGSTVIPPIQMSYFDPPAQRYKIIQSAPVQMTIKPGTKEKGRQVVFTGSGENIDVLGRDIHFIHPVPAQISLGRAPLLRGGAFAALHAVPLLAVIMSVVVARRRKRWMNDAPAYRARFAMREAEKMLRHASALIKENREAFSVISAAVRGYLADKMNKSASGLTDDEIVAFLREKTIDEKVVEALRSALLMCDGAQYSSAASSADQAESTRRQAGDVLESLERGLG